ncbi:hypothetical protein [Acinetobacter lwoffii]|uniref:Integrase n=1 Tax=Acinetobacter lwoffii TaxID=28090 RepID=A0A6N1MYD7_ACILW|nr:hypothetical protein [Acinetobacter lwoffii]QKU22852.1 hypothetical protein FOB19_16515 [Acinetobacter lwoffii]
MINLELENSLSRQSFSNYPSDDKAVSFDKNGKVLSRFSDEYWDFSALSRKYETGYILDFSEKTGLNKETLLHFRLIMLYRLLYNNKSRRDVVSFTTLSNDYYILKKTALLFSCENSSFLSINKNNIVQREYLKNISNNKFISSSKILSLLIVVNNAGVFFNLGEDFGLNSALISRLREAILLCPKSTKQTILIPSRIYAEFIQKSLNHFKILADSLPILNKAITEIIMSSVITTSSDKTKNSIKKEKQFAAVIEKYDLSAFCNHFDIKRNSSKTSLKAFIYNISYVQVLGVFIIACLTGMRRGEILNLGRDCLQKRVVNDRDVWFLSGYTSKTSSAGLIQAKWVTSKLLVDVIETLIAMHPIIQAVNSHYGEYSDVPLKDYPLLPSVIKGVKKLEKLNGSHPLYSVPPIIFTIGDKVSERLCNIVIESQDIDELNHLNPLVDWRIEHNLEVGKVWQFRPHQFRRSLVVYCVRSGLVQFASLKKQLQHLSIDMTTYYGSSAGSASNLFDEDLSIEFKKENARFQFAQYEEKVIDSKDILFGGEGTRLQSLKNKTDVPLFLRDKKQVLKMFENGQLAYKQTPLGGCSRVGPCNKLGFAHVTACITCKDSIFDSSSKVALIKTKKAFESRLMKYESNSIYSRQLQIEINSLNNLLNKIKILEV